MWAVNNGNHSGEGRGSVGHRMSKGPDSYHLAVQTFQNIGNTWPGTGLLLPPFGTLTFLAAWLCSWSSRFFFLLLLSIKTTRRRVAVGEWSRGESLSHRLQFLLHFPNFHFQRVSAFILNCLFFYPLRLSKTWSLAVRRCPSSSESVIRSVFVSEKLET